MSHTLITGASGRIGQALTEALQGGCRVEVHDALPFRWADVREG